jgi:predicted small metal-binding protein
MVLRCRDIGGWCNWEERTETEEKLIEKAVQHASEAHYIKRTLDLEETARKRIRRDQ